MKVFTVSAQPSETSHAVTVAFTCETCKYTNAGSMPTKASYSAVDLEAVANLVARVSARPCGCTDE